MRWMWGVIAWCAVHTHGGMDRTMLLEALHEPLVEIVQPENGKIVLAQEVDVQIALRRQEKEVCIGFGIDQEETFEQCFNESNMTAFHLAGLTPGVKYRVYAKLLDNGKVAALSMRHFRVAGIDLNGTIVTVDTAQQIGVKFEENNVLDMAEMVYAKILAQAPILYATLTRTIEILRKSNQKLKALNYIYRAIQLDDSHPPVYNWAGVVLHDLNRYSEAISHFNKALSLNPNYYEARYNLAQTLHTTERTSEAVAELSEIAQSIRENRSGMAVQKQQEAYDLLCRMVRSFRGWDAALDCTEKALYIWPSNPQFCYQRANINIQKTYVNAAKIDYRVAANDGIFEAEIKIASILGRIGQYSESIEAFDKILEKDPDNSLALALQALVLPQCHPSTEEELDTIRYDMLTRLQTEFQHSDNVNPIINGFHPPSYLLSHNHNNKLLKQQVARMITNFCPAAQSGHYVRDNKVVSEFFAFSQPSWAAPKYPRRRIGFIGEFVKNPILAMFIYQLIINLDPTLFEIYLYIMPHDVAFTVEMRNNIEHLTTMDYELHICIFTIREAKLDMIIYPEIGYGLMPYFLSFIRLAPVQAVWYGHPETTGIPAIDYYVTSSYEAPGHEDHYSERVFPLQGLGVYTSMEALDADRFPQSRDDYRDLLQKKFKCPQGYHLYLVPELVDVLHPDMEIVLQHIQRIDRLASIFLRFSSPKAMHATYLERLRLHKGIDLDRIHFLEIDPNDMARMIRATDVVLAPLYTNHISASLMAVREAIPMVTLPGELWKSRIPAAVLDRINVTDCIATSLGSYARLAVRSTMDERFRAHVVRKLQENRHRAFEDPNTIKEWTRFITFATADNFNPVRCS